VGATGRARAGTSLAGVGRLGRTKRPGWRVRGRAVGSSPRNGFGRLGMVVADTASWHRRL